MRFSAVSPYNAAAKLRLPEKVVVYDSTLRDGEQMPGVHFTLEQKTSIARKLDEVGVHQIEAGFPAVSESEKAAVKEVASLGLDAEVLCLSRALKQDIDAAVDCDVDMVLLFIATSDLHLRYKLKMTREQVLDKAVEAVDYASAHGLKASMSSEDSTRSDVSFMADMFDRCEQGRRGEAGHHGHARLRGAGGGPVHRIQPEGEDEAAPLGPSAQRLRPGDRERRGRAVGWGGGHSDDGRGHRREGW